MNPLKWMIITVSVGRETIENQIGSDSKVLINKNMNISYTCWTTI